MALHWVDGHLDLAYIAMRSGDIRAESSDPVTRCVSLPALSRAGVRLAAATIFVERGGGSANDPWGYRDETDWEGANRAAELQMDYYETLEREGLIRIVRTCDDLHETRSQGILRVIVLMEGADPIRDARDLARWHARGVRMVGLTWALGSRFAGGNQTRGGLTSAGRELVAALDELHMLHDASHLNDESFDNLVASTSRMIVASHSNARALLGANERHITDDQAREIARRGGVIGLNLYGRFLATDRPAILDDAVRHVLHLSEVVNSRTVCVLGSDLDGGFSPAALPEGVRAPEQYHAITDALARHGWSTDACALFAHGNWMRVFERVLSAH